MFVPTDPIVRVIETAPGSTWPLWQWALLGAFILQSVLCFTLGLLWASTKGDRGGWRRWRRRKPKKPPPERPSGGIDWEELDFLRERWSRSGEDRMAQQGPRDVR